MYKLVKRAPRSKVLDKDLFETRNTINSIPAKNVLVTFSHHQYDGDHGCVTVLFLSVHS